MSPTKTSPFSETHIPVGISKQLSSKTCTSTRLYASEASLLPKRETGGEEGGGGVAGRGTKGRVTTGAHNSALIPSSVKSSRSSTATLTRCSTDSKHFPRARSF